MKRKSFYHLSLALPYIALLISAAFSYFVEGLDFFSSPSPPNLISGILMFFTLSAIFWVPLYTWMVLVMLFWGRDKKTDEIRSLYFLSPVLLACAMGFPALLSSAPGSWMLFLWGILRLSNLDFLMPVLFEDFSVDQLLTIGLTWAFMAAICMVVGYAFVGCVLLIERAMQRRGMFVVEEI